MKRLLFVLMAMAVPIAGANLVTQAADAEPAHFAIKAQFNSTPAPTCQVKVGGPNGSRKTVKTFHGWQRRMVVTIPRVAAHGVKQETLFLQCEKQIIRRVVPSGYRPVFKKLKVTFLPLLAGEDNLRNFRDGSNVAQHPGPQEQLGGGRYSNARIADIGLSKVGQNLYTPGSIDHGQCKQAVNDWVYEASGHTQSTAPGYYRAYASQGGELVSRDQAVKGDIIQTYSPSDGGAGYHSGMHTMVVVSHQPGSNTFDVVDSNAVAADVVGHHTYDPYAKASAVGTGSSNLAHGHRGHARPASRHATPTAADIQPASAGHAVGRHPHGNHWERGPNLDQLHERRRNRRPNDRYEQGRADRLQAARVQGLRWQHVVVSHRVESLERSVLRLC